jgi:hypothetical protein
MHAGGLAKVVAVDELREAPCKASVLFPRSGGNIHTVPALREGQQVRRPWALAAWGPKPRYVYYTYRLRAKSLAFVSRGSAGRGHTS